MRYQYHVSSSATHSDLRRFNDDIFFQIPIPRIAFLVHSSDNLIISVNINTDNDKRHLGFIGSSTQSFGVFFGNLTGSINVHCTNDTIFSFSTIVVPDECSTVMTSVESHFSYQINEKKSDPYLSPNRTYCIWHSAQGTVDANIELSNNPEFPISLKFISENGIKTNTEENHTEEQPTEEQSTEEQHTEENPTKEKLTEEQSTEEQSTEEQSTEENPTKEKLTEEQSTEEQPIEEQSTEENPTEEKLTEEQHTEEQPIEEQSTEEQYTEESSTVDYAYESESFHLFETESGSFRNEGETDYEKTTALFTYLDSHSTSDLNINSEFTSNSENYPISSFVETTNKEIPKTRMSETPIGTPRPTLSNRPPIPSQASESSKSPEKSKTYSIIFPTTEKTFIHSDSKIPTKNTEAVPSEIKPTDTKSFETSHFYPSKTKYSKNTIHAPIPSPTHSPTLSFQHSNRYSESVKEPSKYTSSFPILTHEYLIKASSKTPLKTKPKHFSHTKPYFPTKQRTTSTTGPSNGESKLNAKGKNINTKMDELKLNQNDKPTNKWETEFSSNVINSISDRYSGNSFIIIQTGPNVDHSSLHIEVINTSSFHYSHPYKSTITISNQPQFFVDVDNFPGHNQEFPDGPKRSDQNFNEDEFINDNEKNQDDYFHLNLIGFILIVICSICTIIILCCLIYIFSKARYQNLTPSLSLFDDQNGKHHISLATNPLPIITLLKHDDDEKHSHITGKEIELP